MDGWFFIMIILISGASHTGKTMLAKRLCERYQIPYKNIEYIKQHMLLSADSDGINVGNALESNKYVLSENVWFIVENIVRDGLEKGEGMVLDGNFLPPHRVRALDDVGVISMHLIFTPEYIEKNYDVILKHRKEESSIHDDGDILQIMSNEGILKESISKNISKEAMLAENNTLKNSCADEVVSYFMFQENHESEMDLVCELIDCMRP